MLTQSQVFFCFLHCPASKEPGGAQESGRGHSQECSPRLAKGISHTIRHHSQQLKAEQLKEEGRGRCSEWCRLSYTQWVLFCWKNVNFCLPVGRVNEFLILLCFCIQFLLYLVICLPQLMISWTFTFPILSPFTPRDSEWMAVWYWAACWG